jgi:hypothetical protein
MVAQMLQRNLTFMIWGESVYIRVFP